MRREADCGVSGSGMSARHRQHHAGVSPVVGAAPSHLTEDRPNRPAGAAWRLYPAVHRLLSGCEGVYVARVGVGSWVWVPGTRKRSSRRVWRRLTVVALACGVWLCGGTAPAAAQGTGYRVTFAARECESYSDIFANRFRDDLMQTLQNVGPNSPYGDTDLVNPTFEDQTPRPNARRSPAGSSRWAGSPIWPRWPVRGVR